MLTRKQWSLGFLLLLPPLSVATVAYLVLDASTAVSAWSAVLSFFVFCDGWYFVRLIWWALRETVEDAINTGGKRDHLFATSSLQGRAWIVDIDRNVHFNNSRFLRECGFARRLLWHNNGVWRVIKQTGGNLVVGTQTVRYRREIALWQPYTLETRLICWDEKAFYVEHCFVTRKRDGEPPFINAIVLVKNTVLGNLTPAKLIEKLPDLSDDEASNRPLPEDLHKWIESNDISSKALRKRVING